MGNLEWRRDVKLRQRVGRWQLIEGSRHLAEGNAIAMWLADTATSASATSPRLHPCIFRREREAKRAEMAARESALERQLRQLHTWDTQLAAKQRQIREYTELVGGCVRGSAPRVFL